MRITVCAKAPLLIVLPPVLHQLELISSAHVIDEQLLRVYFIRSILLKLVESLYCNFRFLWTRMHC